MNSKKIVTFLTVVCMAMGGIAGFALVADQNYAMANPDIRKMPDNDAKTGKELFEYKNIYYKVERDEDGKVFFTLEDGKKAQGIVKLPASISYQGDKIPVTKIAESAFAGNRMINKVHIPDSVKTIGEEAFANASKLAFVRLPGRLDRINSGTFINSGLFAVHIPASVKSIEQLAFYSDNSLSRVTFDEESKLDSIGREAFGGSMITDITIPSSVTVIKSLAFNNCYFLEYLRYEGGRSNVQGISNDAFNSTALKTFHIPASLINFDINLYTVGEKVDVLTVDEGNPRFSLKAGMLYTKDLKTLCYIPAAMMKNTFVVPTGTEEIKDGTLDNRPVKKIVFNSDLKKLGATLNKLPKLESVVLPANLRELATGSLTNCDNLKSITLPTGLKKIAPMSISNLPALKELVIPEKVNYVGAISINNLSGIENIYIRNKNFVGIGEDALKELNKDVKLHVYSKRAELALIRDKIPEESIVLHRDDSESETVKEAGIIYKVIREPYEDQTGLLQVTGIDSNAEGKSLVKGVLKFPSSVMKNGSEYRVSEIGENAFDDAENLGISKVVLPKSIKVLHSRAFAGLSRLKEVNFNKKSGLFHIGKNVFAGTGITKLALPEESTVIGAESFGNMPELKKFVISRKLESVSGTAFRGSNKLEAIEVPEGTINFDSKKGVLVHTSETTGVASYPVAKKGESYKIKESEAIDDYSFADNKYLTRISTDKIIKRVGNYAFAGAKKLTSVTLGEGVNYIGKDAFAGVNTMKKLVVKNRNFDLVEKSIFPKDMQISVKTNEIKEKFITAGAPAENITVEEPGDDDGQVETYRENRILYVLSDNGTASVKEIAKGEDSIDVLEVPKQISVRGKKYIVNGVELSYLLRDELKVKNLIITEALGNLKHIHFSNKAVERAVVPKDIVKKGEVAEIPATFFDECHNLKEVVIEAESGNFGSRTFNKCSSLERVDMPLIKKTRGLIFDGCNNVKEVNLSSKQDFIPDGLFYKNKVIKEYNVPESVTTLGTKYVATGYFKVYGVFGRAKAIEKVVLPKATVNIGTYTFLNCKNLKEVVINADKLNSVGFFVFQGTSKDLKVYVKNENVKNSLIKRTSLASENIIVMQGK